MPQSCKIALKKQVCSSVYLKCAKNNSHFFDVSSPLLPVMHFQRPCKQVCDDVNLKCLGLPVLFDFPVNNCSMKYDYTGGLLTSSLFIPLRWVFSRALFSVSFFQFDDIVLLDSIRLIIVRDVTLWHQFLTLGQPRSRTCSQMIREVVFRPVIILIYMILYYLISSLYINMLRCPHRSMSRNYQWSIHPIKPSYHAIVSSNAAFVRNSTNNRACSLAETLQVVIESDAGSGL